MRFAILEMVRRYKGKVCKTGDGGKKERGYARRGTISRNDRHLRRVRQVFSQPRSFQERIVASNFHVLRVMMTGRENGESLSLILSTTFDHATFYRSGMRSFYFHRLPPSLSLPPIDRGWQRGCPGRSNPLSPASNFCLPGCLPNDKRDQTPTIGLNAIPSPWKPGQGCYY